MKKRPLYLQTMVFTPLSIRRGVGGEAFLHLQTMVFTPLSIRRGGGGEAFLYLQTMVFPPLSIRRGGGGEAVVGLGERLSFICKQWSSLPSPFGEGLVVRLLVESKKGVSFCVFPCSFRNSVSLSGSVPFVYSVLKMP